MSMEYRKYTPKDIFVSYLGREATEEEIAEGYEPGQRVYNKKTGVEVFDIFTEMVHTHMNHYPEFYAEKFGVKSHEMAGYIKVMSGLYAKQWIDKYVYLVVSELLYETDMPMGEVAKATGFSSVASFSRSFIKRAGMPATEWRRKAREKMKRR